MRIGVFLFAAAFLVFAPTAQALTTGAAGTNFSCDVNTRKCECKGVETGADCTAMAKNCQGKLRCYGEPGEPKWCACDMARKVRAPKNVVPELNGVAPQIAPQ